MPVKLESKGHEAAMEKLMQHMKAVSEVGHKTMDEIAHKQTKELAFNLFRACAEIAPSREELLALPERRGWRIANLHRHIKQPMLKGKDRIIQIMNKRADRRKYLASGWLNCMRMLRGDKLPPSRQLNSGRVEIKETGFASREVTLINAVFEADKVHKVYNIVERAVAKTIQNMQTYIQYKRGELTKEAFKAANIAYNKS